MDSDYKWGITLGVVAVVTIITVIFGWPFYTVSQGERGVYLRWGAVQGIVQPGLGLKLPFSDSVPTVNIQLQNRTHSKLEAYSRDQQPAEIRVSVNYRFLADRVDYVLTSLGGEEAAAINIIDTRLHQELKIVFGQFNAVTAIQDRERLNIEVQEAVSAAVTEASDSAVLVEGVQIEDIAFSIAYEQSVEDRMLAEVEVQRLQQNAERERVQAEIAVIQANARADAVRAEAQAAADARRLSGEANADVIRLTGEAEAAAIEARGAALRDNPQLVQLVTAEKWNGVLPATMLPSGTVPFLDLQR